MSSEERKTCVSVGEQRLNVPYAAKHEHRATLCNASRMAKCFWQLTQRGEQQQRIIPTFPLLHCVLSLIQLLVCDHRWWLERDRQTHLLYFSSFNRSSLKTSSNKSTRFNRRIFKKKKIELDSFREQLLLASFTMTLIFTGCCACFHSNWTLRLMNDEKSQTTALQ